MDCCSVSVELETVVLATKQKCKKLRVYFSHFTLTAAFSAKYPFVGSIFHQIITISLLTLYLTIPT